MREIEHRLQVACCRWFRLQYPHVMIFAIPNGGQRNVIVAKKLKDEGVLAGVADLCILYPSVGCHGLFIEMKTNKGRQTDTQKAFEVYCNKNCYRYEVCRSLDEFIYICKRYFV